MNNCYNKHRPVCEGLFPAQTHMYFIYNYNIHISFTNAGGNQNGKKNENHGW